jgi:hypothetical protein
MPLAAAIPIIQGAIGIGQALFGGGKARKAQRELEKMQTPTYNANQSILDYYNKALQRYNVDPTNSAMYKRSMNNINRGVASGVSALQDRRSAIGGISSILRASNDAKLDAEVGAEQQQSQRFNQLGAATGMKADDDRMQFQYNQVAPFEKKYNLLSMKAGAGNQTANAGMSNIFGGLQSLGNYYMAKEIFGTKK